VFTKSTRQRIAGAERDGVIVERHDTGGSVASDLFEQPKAAPHEAFEAFATLLEGTGQRRGFRFGPRDVFIDWWLAALEAGMLVYLDARDGSDRSRSLGPMAGLYEHKRSFGAHWVAMTGAHERVMRPSRYSIGRVAARLDRLIAR